MNREKNCLYELDCDEKDVNNPSQKHQPSPPVCDVSNTSKTKSRVNQDRCCPVKEIDIPLHDILDKSYDCLHETEVAGPATNKPGPDTQVHPIPHDLPVSQSTVSKMNEDVKETKVKVQSENIPHTHLTQKLGKPSRFRTHTEIPKEYITVLGAGSFGTAIGAMFARNGHHVTILDRNTERAEEITRTHKNPSYLKDVLLPNNLTATSDVEKAFEQCTMVFHAIPVQSSESYLSQFVGKFSSSTPVVCMSKGIHCESLNFMSDIVLSVFGADQKCAFLSGPSFAREIALCQPTGLVIASECPKTGSKIANTVANDHRIRAWTTTDVIGVEVGGALKNVYAIGAGIVQGAGFGYNTTALMVTRGCLEMAKLATALGAKSQTLSGMSGIGDLMLTCFGPASRNRSVGERIGKGETLHQILADMREVAEGVPTIKSAVRLATKLNILDQLPLLQCIHDVVFGEMDKEDIADYIMGLPVTDEMA